MENNTEVSKKRRFRRSRSAPMVELEYHPLEQKIIESKPGTEPGFRNIHPGLKKVAMFLLIYLGIGTICFYTERFQIRGEKTNEYVDALYFCVVTMTTVGYGDLVPNSNLAKLLACGFVFAGMALIALILSNTADYIVEKQEALFVRSNHIVKENEISRVKYKCLLIILTLLVLMFIGTMFLSIFENKDLVDAFYCVCTITTLGYGDHSFSTKGGRIFAVFWILTSTVCLGRLFFYIAVLNAEIRQRELVKWVLSRRVTNQDLEAADLDNDGVVVVSEFVLFKLKEIGKITEEDIAMVMEEFEELDVDQSGTLTLSDISLAQSDPREKTN